MCYSAIAHLLFILIIVVFPYWNRGTIVYFEYLIKLIINLIIKIIIKIKITIKINLTITIFLTITIIINLTII